MQQCNCTGGFHSVCCQCYTLISHDTQPMISVAITVKLLSTTLSDIGAYIYIYIYLY